MWPSFFMKKEIFKGTKDEVNVLKEVKQHYSMSTEDLDLRIQRKNGFDDADKMFSSYIDENSWPYRSLMFDPRPYTVILEKSARLIGSKPKGRLVPREGGDALGARINNELLSYQWDDNSRLGETMISKWIQMDQNARKYGSAFAICKWRKEKRVSVNSEGKKITSFYDGPDFVVCNPRDVLANPSYTYINKWFQYREYVTLEELENTNELSSGNSVYKNLDILRESIKENSKKVGDTNSNYVNQNKIMRGLSDFIGRDETNKTIEIITEYRPNRWITFSPKYGVVIRDIPNPYNHGEIPVVMLRYYPLGDDLYGMSEFEPVSKLIRGINSLLSQHIDTIAINLYPPLMINPINVRMHTIEFSPEAKWLMNQPGVDVRRLESGGSSTQEFREAYSLLVSSLMNAWGETSQGISGIDPFSPDKTATEIKDSSYTRNVRDNMNMIFLSDAIKKQIMFWHSMNQQMMFKGTTSKAKVIRIVGRDAIEYFQKAGLSDISPTDEEARNLAMGEGDMVVPGPKFPVEFEGSMLPKMSMDEYGKEANLLIEPADLMGSYDYIPDIESMKQPSDQDVDNKLTSILGVLTNPQVEKILASEGQRAKVKDLLVKMFENSRIISDADSFFEDIEQVINQPEQNVVNPGGGAAAPAVNTNQGPIAEPGMEGSAAPMAAV